MILTKCWSSESKRLLGFNWGSSDHRGVSTERYAQPWAIDAGRTRMTRRAGARAGASKCERRGGRAGNSCVIDGTYRRTSTMRAAISIVAVEASLCHGVLYISIVLLYRSPWLCRQEAAPATLRHVYAFCFVTTSTPSTPSLREEHQTCSELLFTLRGPC